MSFMAGRMSHAQQFLESRPDFSFQRAVKRSQSDLDVAILYCYRSEIVTIGLRLYKLMKC